MLIELIIFLILGIFAGTFSGLFPGIHINLIGAFLVSLSTTILSKIQPAYLVVFIVAMAITHTFLDFIPSIFLGCPNTDTELSILPGHELLKEGKGYAAVMLSIKGCLIAILLFLLISFPLIFLISEIYPIIQKIIPLLLILAVIFLVFTEKNKAKALLVVILTGFLGLSVLNLDLKEPLLPLLTGLFGSSSLILSIKTKTQIPKQDLKEIKVKTTKPILASLISSPLCGFLPGLGSGQAAILGNSISKSDKKGFLILLGATNTLVMGFSFLALYTISKTRTGMAVAIQEIIGQPSAKILILILIVVLISGIISYFLTKHLAKFFSKRINKINYSLLSKIILIILSLITLGFSGIFGFIVLIASTLTGIYCITLGVKRTNMMGCLLLPTILLYLF
jgi:putative membrane protein